MMGKLVVIRKDSNILTALFENGRLLHMRAFSVPAPDDLVGNVYVGRVDKVLPSMNAAFVSVQKNTNVYLPIPIQKDFASKSVKVLNRADADCLKAGDELLIQVERMGMKDKLPTATARIDLVGQYCVCHVNRKGLHFSSKLSAERIAEFKAALSLHPIEGRKSFGYTIRTNMEVCGDFQAVFTEMAELRDRAGQLLAHAATRSMYSCLWKSSPEYISYLKGVPSSRYDEIVTDDPTVFAELSGFLPSTKLRLYEDASYPLDKLYSIDTHIREALQKNVWLKSGGYLVIEPTEAMTVIDVNSGKGSDRKGKSKEELAFAVNMEAADEIARQLRIRNYSGMIMVDFINMEDKAHRQKLLAHLNELLKEDPVRTRLVDLTPLGIVELTRQKQSKPLADFFADFFKKTT